MDREPTHLPGLTGCPLLDQSHKGISNDPIWDRRIRAYRQPLYSPAYFRQELFSGLPIREIGYLVAQPAQTGRVIPTRDCSMNTETAPNKGSENANTNKGGEKITEGTQHGQQGSGGQHGTEHGTTGAGANKDHEKGK